MTSVLRWLTVVAAVAIMLSAWIVLPLMLFVGVAIVVLFAAVFGWRVRNFKPGDGGEDGDA